MSNTEKKMGASAAQTEGALSPQAAKEIQAWKDRVASHVAPPKPEIETPGDNGMQLNYPQAEMELVQAVLCNAFGVASEPLAYAMLAQVLNTAITSASEASPQKVTDTLEAVRGIGARDPIEGMLAAQMVAAHNGAMEMARRQRSAKTAEMAAVYGNQANKTMRTFAAQVEALKRYRSKASQTVRVERVYVNEGGQAIVGNVFPRGAGGDGPELEGQPHAQPAITDASFSPVWGKDPDGDTVQIASDEEWPMPYARGKSDRRTG